MNNVSVEKISQEEMENYASQIRQIALDIEEIQNKLVRKVNMISIDNNIWYSSVSIKLAEKFYNFSNSYHRVSAKMEYISRKVHDFALTYAEQDRLLQKKVESDLHE